MTLFLAAKTQIRHVVAVLGITAATAVPAHADTGETGENPSGMFSLFQQERALLTGLGSNRAKKLAGISFQARVRLATASNPLTKFRPRARTVPMTLESLAAMPPATGGDEWACLTEALYFEARGESVKAIAAVAEVVLNRRNSSKFPNSICGVISQGVGGAPGCQFSYKCDGKAEKYNEPRARDKVGKIARLAMDGQLPAVTGGALYYHNGTVSPSWSRKFRRTANVGGHFFYHPG